MFEDELDRINKEIDKWQAKIAEGVEDIADGIMESLFAMKKSVEKQIQKYNMERELEREFGEHVDRNSCRLRDDGDRFNLTFLKETNKLKERIGREYEASSSKRVEENFDDTHNQLWLIEQDFSRVVLSCSMRSFF